jgi:hypothetical protein
MDFKTEEELTAFVSGQLRQVVPAGWTVQGGGPKWVVRKDVEGGGWKDYQVLLWWAGEDSRLVVTHGNSDHGPMRPEQVLLKATMIDLAGLHWFLLADLLRAVLADNTPNTWGLT